MYPEWRDFLQRLPARAHFLHPDELQQLPKLAQEPLPAIFWCPSEAEPWRVFLSAVQLNPLDLPGLIRTVETRLQETNQPASGL
jgi:hypothetical protein